MTDVSTGINVMPSSLAWSISSVKDVSHNTFQLSPSSGSTVAGAGQNIRFSLPTSSLMDMKSSRIAFNLRTSGTAGVRLPAQASYCFSRLQCLAGGQTIAVVNEFGLSEYVKSVAKNKKYLPTEHPYTVATMTEDGAPLSAAGTIAEQYNDDGIHRFSMDLGPLAKCRPQILPMDTLPAMEIILTVAGPAVLSSVLGIENLGNAAGVSENGAGTATFTVNDCVLNASVYNLGNSAYSEALRRRMESIGMLEIVLPEQMTSFDSAWTGSSRFSFSSHSLDVLHSCWRATGARGYTTQKGAAVVAGSATDGVSSATNAAMDLHNFGAGVPIIADGDTDPATGGNGIAQYTSAHQQLQAPFSAAVNGGKADAANLTVYNFAGVGDASLNYRINSALTPQFSCQPHQWQYISAEANQVEKTRAPNTPAFLHNYFLMDYNFNLPNPDNKPCISGLNTLGAGHAFVEISASGAIATGNYDITTFAESTTVLQVAPGRMFVALT